MSQNEENTVHYPGGLCQHCCDPEQTAYKIDLNHPGNDILRKQMEFVCSNVLNNVSLPEFLCKSCIETVQMFFDYKEMLVTNHTKYFENLLLKRPLGHTLDCECTRCHGIFTLNDENEECRKCKNCKMDLIEEGIDLPLMTLKKVAKKDGKKNTKGRAKIAKKVTAAEPAEPVEPAEPDEPVEPVEPRRSARHVSSLTVENVRNIDDKDRNGGSRKRSRSTSSTSSSAITIASSTEDGQKDDTLVQPKGRAKVAKKVAAAEPVVLRRSERNVCSSSTVENVDDMNSNGGSRRHELQLLQLKRSRNTSSTASSASSIASSTASSTASRSTSSTASTSSRRAPKAISSASTGRKIV